MTAVIETQESRPNFTKLKDELLNHRNGRVLYEDPIFQPRFSVLFNKHSTLDFQPSEIIWNRPGQLSKQPCLVSSHGLGSVKVFSGRLSPEWFPVLFALLKERNLLDLVVPNLVNQNTFNESPTIGTPNRMAYCGAFQFRFRRGGVVEDVVIDDKLPTTLNCHLLTAISCQVDEFLPALLEKAYAKFIGGYYNFDQHNYLTALMDFTGGLVETISMRGNELLTMTEIESLYSKFGSLVGNSFAICQVGKKDSLRPSTEIYLINDFNQIPSDPPTDLMEYFMKSFNDTQDELVPVVRMISFNGEDGPNSYINGKRINEKWDESMLLIRKKYGVIYTDKRESWVPIEELPYFCDQVVLTHLLYRNAIVALAKKQEYWTFFFYDHFWHRDDPRGDVDLIGEAFLKNRQYICVINKEDGCNIKLVLTITQRYVDSGANTIQKVQNAKTGITILQVERNRQYRLHSLRHARVIQSHVDCQIDRTLVLSTSLEIGRYVIVPWISAGTGTRYTIQLFSSAHNTEFSRLELDIPKEEFCVTCQIRQTALETKMTIQSIYPSMPTNGDSGQRTARKDSAYEMELCHDCRLIYPKRATRIAVKFIEILEALSTYMFPTLYFIICCEKEKYKSRLIMPSLCPQMNEQFLFYRSSSSDSKAKIEVFAVGTLGFKSTIAIYNFLEKDLRDGGNLFVDISIPDENENVCPKCRLVIDIQNYLPSEFSVA